MVEWTGAGGAVASNLVSITANYVTNANDLLNGTYEVGQNLYLKLTDLTITNKSADAVVVGSDAGGIIAVLDHAPSISVSGSVMALRLKNCSTTLATRIKTLLAAKELV